MKQAVRTVLSRVLEKSASRRSLHIEDLDFSAIRRIIIIRPHDSLRHLMLSIPTLRAVWQHFPDAHITLITKPEFAAVVENNLYLDEVIPFDPDSRTWSVAKFQQLMLQLRPAYDLAIALNTTTHSLISDLIAVATRAKYMLGLEPPETSGLDSRSRYNLVAPSTEAAKHEIEKNLSIVRYIGLDTNDLSETVHLTREEKLAAIEFLSEHLVRPDDVVVALLLGPSESSANNWPIEYFEKVAKHFKKKRKARIVVSWSTEQSARGEQLVQNLPFSPIVIADRSLRELAAILYFCHTVVTNDLDLIHLTAGVNTPLVALFGEVDPRRWKPIGDTFVAMKSENDSNVFIPPKAVIQKVEEIIDSNPQSLRLDFDDFDISDQVLEGYLEIIENFED